MNEIGFHKPLALLYEKSQCLPLFPGGEAVLSLENSLSLWQVGQWGGEALQASLPCLRDHCAVTAGSIQRPLSALTPSSPLPLELECPPPTREAPWFPCCFSPQGVASISRNILSRNILSSPREGGSREASLGGLLGLTKLTSSLCPDDAGEQRLWEPLQTCGKSTSHGNTPLGKWVAIYL